MKSSTVIFVAAIVVFSFIEVTEPFNGLPRFNSEIVRRMVEAVEKRGSEDDPWSWEYWKPTQSFGCYWKDVLYCAHKLQKSQRRQEIREQLESDGMAPAEAEKAALIQAEAESKAAYERQTAEDAAAPTWEDFIGRVGAQVATVVEDSSEDDPWSWEYWKPDAHSDASGKGTKSFGCYWKDVLYCAHKLQKSLRAEEIRDQLISEGMAQEEAAKAAHIQSEAESKRAYERQTAEYAATRASWEDFMNRVGAQVATVVDAAAEAVAAAAAKLDEVRQREAEMQARIDAALDAAQAARHSKREIYSTDI